MKQQVNLYQPIFRRERKVFSAAAMLQITAVFVVALMVVYGYGLWRSQALEAQVERLEDKRDAATERVESLGERFPPPEPSPELEARQDRLAAEKERKQQAVRVLSEGRFGNTEGFAEELAALARNRLDGLWLTGVSLYEGGQEMTLQGTTQADYLVPRLLQELSDEAALTGTEFREVRLDRDEERSWEVDFVLRTRASKGEGGDGG